MRMLFAAAALALVPAAGFAADAAPAATAAARLNLDTPVETIVADAAGKAVLDANLSGLTTYEHYDMIKTYSLRALSRMAPDKLPAEAIAKTETDLAAIK